MLESDPDVELRCDKEVHESASHSSDQRKETPGAAQPPQQTFGSHEVGSLADSSWKAQSSKNRREDLDLAEHGIGSRARVREAEEVKRAALTAVLRAIDDGSLRSMLAVLMKRESQERHGAAVKIQSIHRGRQDRKKMDEVLQGTGKTSGMPAKSLQSRLHDSPKEGSARIRTQSPNHLQAVQDGVILYLVFRHVYSAVAEMDRQQQRAAVQLQRCARRFFASKEVKRQRQEQQDWVCANAHDRHESLCNSPPRLCAPRRISPLHSVDRELGPRIDAMSEDAKSALGKIQGVVNKAIKRVQKFSKVDENDRCNPQAMRDLLDRQQEKEDRHKRQFLGALRIQRAFRGKQARSLFQTMLQAREEARKAAEDLNNEWERNVASQVRFSLCHGNSKKSLKIIADENDRERSKRKSRREGRQSRRDTSLQTILDDHSLGTRRNTLQTDNDGLLFPTIPDGRSSSRGSRRSSLLVSPTPDRDGCSSMKGSRRNTLQTVPDDQLLSTIADGCSSKAGSRRNSKAGSRRNSSRSPESLSEGAPTAQSSAGPRRNTSRSPPTGRSLSPGTLSTQEVSSRRSSVQEVPPLLFEQTAQLQEEPPTVRESPELVLGERSPSAGRVALLRTLLEEESAQGALAKSSPSACEEEGEEKNNKSEHKGRFAKLLRTHTVEQINDASERIQAAQRGHLARKEARNMRKQATMLKVAVKLQALCRGWQARRAPATAHFAPELLQAAALAAASQSAQRPFTRRELNATVYRVWQDEMDATLDEDVLVVVCDIAIQFDGDSSDGDVIDLIRCSSPRCVRRPTCCFVQERDIQTDAVDTEQLEEDVAIDSHRSAAALQMPRPMPGVLQKKTVKQGKHRRRLAPTVTMKVHTLFNSLQPFKQSKCKAANGVVDAFRPRLDVGTVLPRSLASARPPFSVQADVKPPSSEKLQGTSWQPPPFPASGKVLADHIGQVAAFESEELAPSTPPTSAVEQGPLRPVDLGTPSPMLPPCTPRLGTAELQGEWATLFATGLTSEEEKSKTRTGIARVANSARQQRQKVADGAALFALPATRSAKSGARPFPRKEPKGGMKRLPWLPLTFKVEQEPGALNHEAVNFSRRLLDRCYSDESRPGTSNPIVGRFLVAVRQDERQAVCNKF